MFLDELILKHLKKRYNLCSGEILEYIKKRDGIECNKNKIVSLFLGSSHTQMGINSNAFEHNTAYNLAIGSQDLYNSYELYKKYCKEIPNLKNIFIEYSVFSAGYEIEKSINSRFAYYYNFVFEIPFKYPTKSNFVKSNINLVYKKAMRGYKLPKGYNGYLDYVTYYDENIAIRDVKAHIKHATRNNKQEQYIKQTIELANSLGQNVYILVPPHSPNYITNIKEEANKMGYSLEDLFTPLNNLKNEIDLRILNYFNNKEFYDEDFYDWEHLNPSGALKLTSFIKSKMAEIGAAVESNSSI